VGSKAKPISREEDEGLLKDEYQSKKTMLNMKTLDDFRRYYADFLSKELGTAESVRRSTILKALLVWVLAVPITALAIWGSTSVMGEEYFWALVALNVLVFGFLGYMVYREVLSSPRYYHLFKGRVIDGIIRFIDERLQYMPHRAIPVAVFGQSGLFHRPIHKYEGDDYCLLQLEGGSLVEFSEVHAYQKIKNEQGMRWEPVFEGLFAHAKLAQPRGGELYVVPKGTPAEEVGTRTSRLQSYPVENSALGMAYEVYANSPLTVKRYLTAELIEAIVAYHQQNPTLPLYLGMQGTHVYIAIPRETVLLEPNVWHSLADVQSLEKFYLDLNTLWSILSKAVGLYKQTVASQPEEAH
jgi:hypothetical protein